MKTVYRYGIPPDTEFTIQMPIGARILHVGENVRPPSDMCMWALVDPERETTTRKFAISGTGTESPNGDYIGTIQSRSGFVWHVWEIA